MLKAFWVSLLTHVTLLLPCLLFTRTSEPQSVSLMVELLPPRAQPIVSLPPLPKKQRVVSGGMAQKSSVEESSVASTQSPDSGPILGSELGIVAQYPRLSRLLGESGRVVVETSRELTEVVQSSGFDRLDLAALGATRSALESGILSTLLARRKELQLMFVFKLVETQ